MNQFEEKSEEEMIASLPWEMINSLTTIQKQNCLNNVVPTFKHNKRSISSNINKTRIKVNNIDKEILKKSKEDYPRNKIENNEFRLIQAEISDFIIIEPLKHGKQYSILQEKDWKKIIKQKSLIGYNMLDIHVSLLLQNISYHERKDLWLIFCQIDKLKEQQLQKKIKFIDYSLQQNPFESQIKKDVCRSLKQSTFFNQENENSLKKILIAYANFDPELGYTQGMNIIAANLLICYDLKSNGGKFLEDVEIYDPNRDEIVFLIVIYIMIELDWRSVFMTGFPGLIRMMKTLENKIKQETPQLYNHFVNLEIDLNMCFQSQYLSLLMYSISWKISGMILDLFLFEGESIIHTFIIGMLKYCQDILLKLSTFEEIVNFCKNEMINQFYELFSLQLDGKKDLTNTLINLGFIKIQDHITNISQEEPKIEQIPIIPTRIQKIKNTGQMIKRFFTKKNI